MARAVAQGGGAMAQFNIPELGGSGQWMSGGMTMVGDMFNYGLQSRVSNLCGELAGALASGEVFATPPAAASRWPAALGAPASSGGQNAMRYAYFPNHRRLAVDRGDGGPVLVFDTLDHQITGFGQQQQNGSDPLSGVIYYSQRGVFTVSSLPQTQAAPFAAPEPAPPIGVAIDPPAPPQPMRPQDPTPAQTGGAQPALGDADTIINALERLGKLHGAGVLTDTEFSAKKAELLARL